MSQKVKTWESHVPGCFGGSDHIFAGHPAEEKRAKELRKVCSEQRIPMDDVAKAIEHFLKSKKVGDALIQEQVERARKFLNGPFSPPGYCGPESPTAPADCAGGGTGMPHRSASESAFFVPFVQSGAEAVCFSCIQSGHVLSVATCRAAPPFLLIALPPPFFPFHKNAPEAL